jgi:hypothetical protein
LVRRAKAEARGYFLRAIVDETNFESDSEVVGDNLDIL